MKTRIKHNSLTSALPLEFMGGRMASIFLLSVCVLFIFASIVNPVFFQNVRTTAADVFSPVLKVVNAPFQGAADFIGGVSGLTNLRAENAKLRAENARLREWYQTALMLQAENQSLQALLNVKVDEPHKFITAKVVADSGNSFVNTVLVGVGTREGVKKNQAVLAGEGLIGRVIETGRTSARIMLLTDYNSRIPVLLEGSRQKAVLSGSNSDHPILKYIPHDSEVKVGTRLITSGDGGVFPSGLPVGRIQSVNGDKVVVQPFTDIHHVTNVRIVNNKIDPNLSAGSLDDF